MAEPGPVDRRRADERFRSVSARISRTLGEASEGTLGTAALTVLEDLALWLEADCAFVTLVDEAGLVSDEWNWCRPGASVRAPEPGAPLADTFGSGLEFLKAGRSIVIGDLATVELGGGERRLATVNDLRALVIAPVRIAGVFLGIVGLQVFGRPRSWKPSAVNNVELVASVLVQTVARTRQRGALEQANARARRIARYVPSPLIVFDDSLAVTWVSPSYSSVTGRRAKAVVGRPVADLFVPGDLATSGQLPAAGPQTVRLRLANGAWRWSEVAWQAIDDDESAGGRPGEVILEVRDVHDRKLQAEQLRRDADHDALTGALNRTGLDRCIAQLERDGTTILSAFCDLNDFKRWNDTHGHLAGDVLLRSVAEALSATVRVTDLVARIGGDEFVIVMLDPTEADRVGLAARLEEAIGGLTATDAEMRLTAAVGVSGIGPAGGALGQRQEADLAMYDRKASHARPWRSRA